MPFIDLEKVSVALLAVTVAVQVGKTNRAYPVGDSTLASKRLLLTASSTPLLRSGEISQPSL
jgi:hypothetical protein